MTFGTVLRATLAVGLAAAFAISGAAQDVTPGAGAPADVFPQPDRPVADIISPIWHDENERDKAGEPQQLVRLLGIKPGMTVADIGAGSGYYVVRLSPIVGASGRVIAEDVVPDYLENLRRRVRDLGLANVDIVRGEAHDPKLPAQSLDLAILVHMYHEIAQPYALLYNLVPALKPGARIGIVDAFAPTARAWYAARSAALRASSRRLSRDQPRSADRQRRLPRDLCAAFRRQPPAAGKHRRLQGAIAR